MCLSYLILNQCYYKQKTTKTKLTQKKKHESDFLDCAEFKECVYLDKSHCRLCEETWHVNNRKLLLRLASKNRQRSSHGLASECRTARRLTNAEMPNELPPTNFTN